MSEIRRILVVDDEKVMTDYLTDLLRDRYDVTAASSVREALGALADRDFDLVITDLQLDSENVQSGLDIVQACCRRPRPLPVVVMTAYASIDMAVKAMKMGAAEFLTKPFGIRELEGVFQRLRKAEPLAKTQPTPGRSLSRNAGGQKRLILGRSEAMRRVYELIENVAMTNATIMLTGESGTGKELVASAIHTMSRRAGNAFIKVNCAAITDTLMESTLFGHEKGAFTGAVKRTPGKFELANGGTLLLDEISEMKPEMQSKLLRVLQEREFELVGGTTTIPVDVRIIATSNRNLKAEVRKGTFREDLFFRLNVVPLHVPPLRERSEDIPPLVEHFMVQSASDNGLPTPHLAPEVLRELCRLSWPGNVRQLQNAVERAVVLSRNGSLLVENFLLDEDLFHSAEAEQAFDQDISLKEMEKRMILSTLARYRENRTQAARHLGISVRTLRNKLNLYRVQSRSTAA
ncbi:MAG: sigma-54-dependent Fis family transcriptional regulator [bacterium]|nr:sigma-54-dependent Fis family transcriptional regulator [bacterium]